MAHIVEHTDEAGQAIGVFTAKAGFWNPGDAPLAGEPGVRISIRNPARFANIVVDPGVTTKLKPAGSWQHLFIIKGTVPADNKFTGGAEDTHLVRWWAPGEHIATFKVEHAESFGYREVGALVSTWPGRGKQRNMIALQSNETGNDENPWDPIKP